MTIISRKPLNEEQLNQIEQILRESECPHESLRNTFPERYGGLIGNLIFFDDATPQDFSIKEELS